MIATEPLRFHNMRTTLLANNETKITKARLEELERKERAHDAYVRATRKMGDRLAALQEGLPREDLSGYRAAIRDFSELVVREDA